MKLFSLLFDSYWRQNGDEVSRARQNRHYNSMAEQVMANRTEAIHLQGELDRLSHDLTQAMTLNRVLLKLLVSEGVCTPDQLERGLREALSQSEEDLGENGSLSRFCEDCGRPLTYRGRSCPFCTELSFPEEAPELAETEASSRDSEPSEPEIEETATKKKEASVASQGQSSETTGKTKKRRRSSKQK